MSLAILKRKADAKFNQVSSNAPFSINGPRRANHYIGRGAHRPTPTRSCEALSLDVPKPSVASGAVARGRLVNVRADAGIVQPDANFPENDSQGIYLFNKRLKHDCVTATNSVPLDCVDNDCGSGSRRALVVPVSKDFAVHASYDDYLSKNLLPQCANIVSSHIKINNIGITNARCGSV